MTEKWKSDLWFDLETRSPVPIKNGTHAYAEQAEIMLWAYAVDSSDVHVWDILNCTDNYTDELSGLWVEDPCGEDTPPLLRAAIEDQSVLIWGHNSGMFDFVVLDKQQPWFAWLVPIARRRDTMVQAYAHSLPGALDKLGEILQLADASRKMKTGRKYITMFCIPQADGSYKTKQTNPKEWQEFIEYAARDITTMRAAHHKMPKWNYKTGKQVDLWHEDLRINSRGMFVDQELATKAIEAADTAKARMARRTVEMTDGEVASTTQRDVLLKYILESYGVELPDMRADTLERRMEDPDLPTGVKELLGIRLRASMNSVSKYKTLLKGVSSDGRLRGCAQFRGAGRTGRWAHRLFQPGNLPRPAYDYPFIEVGISAIKAGCLDLVVENEMEMCASAIRGAIIAPPGRKLIVADLANIEGRVAAWLAGESWKLQAFTDYDTVLGLDDAGKTIRKGLDLYITAYCNAFRVEKLSPDKHEAFLQRQIGKVMELMFQYGGGVGAWITGAVTYGIDLEAMTEAVYDTLPSEVVREAESFLEYLYDQQRSKLAKTKVTVTKEGRETTIEQRMHVEPEVMEAAKLKVRFGLSEKVFVTCDSLKRLWRTAHPRISTYWKELEETINEAIDNPAVTLTARKLKIRRDGSWLRIALPSGRSLCYPNIHRTKKGEIAYTGQDTYTRQWQEVKTYGGKLFENIVQAVACDQFAECMPTMRSEGYLAVLGCHDEWVCEVDDDGTHTAQRLAEIMCAPNGWNDGLPLAAAGEEMKTYHKT